MSLFSPEKQAALLPAQSYFHLRRNDTFAGITCFASREDMLKHCDYIPEVRTKKQWYEIVMPGSGFFFDPELSIKGQAFPVLHILMSQNALQLLFVDDFMEFSWKLAIYIRDTSSSDKERIIKEENALFFNKLRENLFALSSGGDFLAILQEKSGTHYKENLVSFFSHIGIAGIKTRNTQQDIRYLVFNPKNIKIISIHRDNP